MNTPYYLMTQQDKEYLLRGEEFLRNLLKTRLIDFSINEIKAAGYTCPDYRSLYLLGRDLPPVPAIYFLFNQAGGIYYIGQSVMNRYQYPRHFPTSLGTAVQILPEKAHCCSYGV